MAPKNPAAVALGRKGGKARIAKFTKEELSAANKRAAEARWAKLREGTQELEKMGKELRQGTKALLKEVQANAKRAEARAKKKVGK